MTLEQIQRGVTIDVEYFSKPDRIYSLKDLQDSPPPRRSGVYCWYFSKLPPYVPSAGCVVSLIGRRPFRNKIYLLYIGKASNLKERILDEHFRGGYVRGKGISSLRLSLGCLLCRELGIYLEKHPDFPKKDYTFGEKGDQKLTAWMSKYARVTWVEIENKEDRERFEKKAIQSYSLPLNTENNANPYEPLVILRDRFRYITKSQWPKNDDFKRFYKIIMKGN